MDTTLAAVVTGVFGLLVLLVEKGRRENTRDHGVVIERLLEIREDIRDIDKDVAVIEHKLDEHMNDPKSHSGKKK